MYKKYIKRGIDIILSLGGLIVLSPIFLLLCIAIKIDSRGPILFKQKRVGIHKTHFNILKFRTMRIDTPKDMPTHLLANPEQYITRIGKFMRKTSLDELPQIINILRGDMSVIGPRPALWNQYDLLEERDKYGANDVMPGLTGWAQINGRDELEIPLKASLDGEYVKKMSFSFDVKCFFGTIFSVLKSDGVVEGGTGEMNKSTGSEDLDREEVMKENKVSVIVATYRREKELKRALDSLAIQTYKNIEIIVIDDNDNLEWNKIVKGIIDDFKNRYPSKNIIYVDNHPNQGSAKSRNIGIDLCHGNYITFLDDDDLYEEKKIEKQLRDMVISEADYGITDLYLYNEKNELRDKRIRSYIKSTRKDDLMKYHLLFHMTGTDTLMFKAEYLRSIGGFPEIDIGDEFYLVKEAILGEGKFVYSQQCYVKAYVHSANDSGLSTSQGKIEGENRIYEDKKKYFHYLSKSAIRYLKVRHYAVIAFSAIRMKKYDLFIKSILQAFFISPSSCIRILINR